jgi:hypothetical protein
MEWFIATTYIAPYLLLLLMDEPVFVYSRKHLMIYLWFSVSWFEHEQEGSACLGVNSVSSDWHLAVFCMEGRQCDKRKGMPMYSVFPL